MWRGDKSPRHKSSLPPLFPNAHHFVTERPSVTQIPAQVTAVTLLAKSPRKISSLPQPLIQALSSPFKTFLEHSSSKLAA
jgi:hypothetical protein